MIALLLCAPLRASAEPASRGVIVRAERARTPASRRDPTAASTVVPEEELSSPGKGSADVLMRVPGVQVSRTGTPSDLATAGIRGASSAQTPVYLGGIRINDDVTGSADLSTVPLWMLHRVEVFRGNAPAGVDRLGIGGAVLFEPKVPRRNRVGAGVGAGSFGRRSLWVAGQARARSSSALVALRTQSADNDYGFSTVDASGARVEMKRKNADYRSYDAWALGRHDLGRGARVTTVMNVFDREQGSPGLALVQADRARTRVRRLVGGVRVRVPCGRSDEGLESCVLDLQTSAVVSRLRLSDPLRQLSPFVSTNNAGERLTQRATVRFFPTDSLDVGAGLGVGLTRLVVTEAGRDPIAGHRASLRPTLSARWRITDRLTAVALGALSCQATSRSARPDECNVLEPVGRGGAAFELLPGASLRANVGRYVRVPTLGELFGSSALVRGNAALRPETGVSADAGLRLEKLSETGEWSGYLDAFAFVRRADDLIAFQQNALGVIVPFNARSARIIGAEFAGGVAAFDAVRFDSTLSLLDPRDTSPDRLLHNDLLPYRSRLTTSQAIELYTRPRLDAVQRAWVRAIFNHRASKLADRAGLIVIPAQTTLDAELGMALCEGCLEGQLAVRNLTAARQFDSVGLPLPGRSVHVALEGWWP